MKEMGLAYGALVGFSGSVYDQDTHQDYTEASMNGIPDNQTEESLKDPKYRLLIVNNKFQTGYDEPLLHTMYVDKKFGGLQCVQTLSRLNRTMSGKTDTFVLDFVNEPDEVQESFQPYFEGTLLEGETDPNRLYAIAQDIDEFNLFQTDTVNKYVETFYLEDIPLEQLQGILDFVVDAWRKLEEAERETFRASIQSFIRLYGYISQIISFKDIALEKLFIFLRGLNKKLPKRDREQLSDILSSIDLEYFKIEKKYSTNIELEAGPEPFGPIEDASGGGVADEPVDFLSAIIQTLNDSFEGDFTEEDKVRIEKIRKQLNEDTDLREVMHGENTESNKREVFNSTFNKLLVGLVGESLDFYNKLSETKRNRFVQDRIFERYSRAVGNSD
jgi:type I restriction enzyme, R subunit